MLRSQSFGKRGIAAPFSAAATPVLIERRSRLDDVEDATSMSPPVATFGLVFILAFIYLIELKLAAGLNPSGKIDLAALVAFGAAGYDRIFEDREYWRIFLAPLLHANVSHILGNSIALGFVGIRLEPSIGTARFFGIFALSALGGIAGSLIGNPHAVVTVGASGAITGVIGALFVASFVSHPRYDAGAMRRTALRFGAPALLPLLFGAHGHTDYHAHLGGALTGAGAFLLQTLGQKPGGGTGGAGAKIGWATGLACLVLSVSCAVCVHRSRTIAPSMQAVVLPLPKPVAPPPATASADADARIARADALRRAHRLFAAEMELRAAVTLATSIGGLAAAGPARARLAEVLVAQGRRAEARQVAPDLCRTGAAAEREILQRAKLCP